MVIIYIRLRKRRIDQIIGSRVLIGQKILRIDLIIRIELIHLCIIENKGVNILSKLAVFVIPKDQLPCIACECFIEFGSDLI